MIFWTTFIIRTFDQNTFLLVILGKCPDLRKNMSFWNWNLFFNFGFIRVFFSIPITFTNFLEFLSSHFFDFLSYMAGNCILVWEVETNLRKIKKCVILKPELIFQFRFYSFFFDSDYLYELFGLPIGPFFRFFVLNGRKSHFLVSNIAKFC